MKQYRYLTIKTTDFFNLGDQLTELGLNGYRLIRHKVIHPNDEDDSGAAIHFVIMEAEVIND